MLRFSRLVGGGFLLVVLLALAGRVFGAPVGRGLVDVAIGPTKQPIELQFWYSTEKQQWLEAAVARFEAENPTVDGRPINITLVGLGSGEMVHRIARQEWRGETPPAILSPASMVQIEQLKSEWPPDKGEIVLAAADAPRPLVITPLVLVAWEQRAQTLWPNGPEAQTFWQGIHDALVDPKGWQGRGGSAQWGLVKFGHTSPLTSNSGAQTLLLLAYSFANKTRGLSVDDVQNPAFQTWMREIEQAVPEFGDSTGTFMSNIVQRGPGSYDLGAVYENIALQDAPAAQSRWGQNLRIYYPPVTLLSEHPFAILAGTWVTPEQQAAARQLRSFLLSTPIQELALESGFRPANPNVSITTNSAKNPFVSAKSSGVMVDLGAQAETPSAEVVRALLDAWRTQVGR